MLVTAFENSAIAPRKKELSHMCRYPEIKSLIATTASSAARYRNPPVDAAGIKYPTKAPMAVLGKKTELQPATNTRPKGISVSKIIPREAINDIKAIRICSDSAEMFVMVD